MGTSAFLSDEKNISIRPWSKVGKKEGCVNIFADWKSGGDCDMMGLKSTQEEKVRVFPMMQYEKCFELRAADFDRYDNIRPSSVLSLLKLRYL